MQKHGKFEKISGCNYSYRKRAIHRMDGWLQLELRINSIPLKKGMTTSACFKETQYS